jgi:hypothetical protein
MFGVAMIVLGYAVLYWGLHHFQGLDCPCPPHTKPCPNCRHSLLVILGIDQLNQGGKFQIPQGAPVQYGP